MPLFLQMNYSFNALSVMSNNDKHLILLLGSNQDIEVGWLRDSEPPRVACSGNTALRVVWA